MKYFPFKKLLIWNRAIDLAKDIYVLTSTFPKEELFGLVSQMKRASISIASNIAEGSQRSTRKDFSNFLSVAKGSLCELETQCLIAKNLKFCTEQECNEICKKTDELGRMLYAFKRTLATSK